MALTTAQLQNAYVAFFNRPADNEGLRYWGSYAGSSADRRPADPANRRKRRRDLIHPAFFCSSKERSRLLSLRGLLPTAVESGKDFGVLNRDEARHRCTSNHWFVPFFFT